MAPWVKHRKVLCKRTNVISHGIKRKIAYRFARRQTRPTACYGSPVAGLPPR